MGFLLSLIQVLVGLEGRKIGLGWAGLGYDGLRTMRVKMGNTIMPRFFAYPIEPFIEAPERTYEKNKIKEEDSITMY